MSEKVNNNVLDPEMLTEALKSQTKDTIDTIFKNAVKSYLKEAVEDEDLENDTEKVEPTQPETDEPTVDEVPADGTEPAAPAVGDAQAPETTETGATAEPVEGEGGDEWSEFDDYKVGDGEYDMTGVDDPEKFKKVWKLMQDEDEVVVKQQNDGKIEIKDNETGADYIIELGDEEPENTETDGEEPVFEITFNKKPNMMEANEFTDNYQSKDVLVGREPYDAPTPNETNDWDEGAPKDGKAKPWAGPSKEKGKPYAGEVNEEGGDLFEISFDECGVSGDNPMLPTDGPMEEGLGMADERSMRLQKDGRENPRHNNAYGNTTSGSMDEAIQKKLGKIEEENKVLKSSLVKFRKALNEAIVTNCNLGHFVKLVLENATTTQEKHDILKRFSNEAKTVEQSKVLFESINKQLKTVKESAVVIDKPMNINESAVKNINENTIYKNDDEGINYALDMIQRMNNL